MKITICGSIAFYDEMTKAKHSLERLGHRVEMPPLEIIDGQGNKIHAKEFYRMRKSDKRSEGWIWERKGEAIRRHFGKIEWCDAILVLNHDKNNIRNYIGANTLMEMGLALHLNKKIFLLNPIPEISYKEEILGMQPIIIERNLENIK